MSVCILASVIGNAKCIFPASNYILIHGMSVSTIFLHIISKTA